MSETTAISWTDATYNPWSGCTKVSPGCANCYAERLFERWGKDFSVVARASERTFRSPLGWKAPRMIFTCSMSDFFHEAADDWRAEAWDIIRRTPRHTYQILTKRPERIAAHLPDDWGTHGYPNVWLGTSVENQRWTSRIPSLIDVPATVRFLSCEPLLGRIDLSPWIDHLDWVIVGGESGTDYRPMNLDHAYSLYRQCAAHGVAFFMKQDSSKAPGARGRIPDDLWVQEMPT